MQLFVQVLAACVRLELLLDADVHAFCPRHFVAFGVYVCRFWDYIHNLLFIAYYSNISCP